MAQAKPNPIAADATSVYWGNDTDRTVMKAALAGGAATTLLPAPTDTVSVNLVNALLVDGTTLYVGRGVDSYKLPTAGGTLVHLSHSPDADLGYPGAFALDATHLYQAEINHNAITRETLDGLQNGFLEDNVTRQMLAPDRLAVSQANLVTDAIAISGQYVVWADGQNIKVYNKDAASGTLVAIASPANFNSLSGFVISGNKIYLGEAADNVTSADNAIEVVPLSFTVPASGVPTATVIANHQPNPAEFAADATSIYFTSITAKDATGTCKIMKLAK